jgi:hypothetical protein
MIERYSSGDDVSKHTVLNVLFFLLLIQAFFIAICNKTSGPDLFLAFAAGAKTLQVGPASPDTWSFTAFGRMWIDQGWLSHLILTLFLRAFGPGGPFAVKILLLAGCVGLLFVHLRKLRISTPIILVALCLAIVAAGPFLAIRAENFGVFCFVLFLVTLSQADKNAWLRWGGLPLVITIWSNSHGSFMLGLGLLAVKIGILLLRRLTGWRMLFSGDTPVTWRSVGEWMLIGVICVVLTAVANPFGVENLLTPFRQLGSELVTSHSADWLPLLSAQNMSYLMAPGSVFGYLFFILVVLCSFFLVLGAKEGTESAGPASSKSTRQKTKDRDIERVVPVSPSEFSGKAKRASLVTIKSWQTDWIMEITIVLVMTFLAFRFRRLIVFASFALATIASMTFSLLANRLQGPITKRLKSQSHSRLAWPVALACALLLVVGTTWFVYRFSIIPYSPENPLRPGDRSLARDLMSYDTFSQPLISFLKSNKIEGNVLAGWEISSFLLHEAPKVKVFMDTRDQSFYPQDVIRDFFAIMGVTEDRQASSLSLLDKYAVATVVMTTDPYDFDLAKRLIRSRLWGCVYRDDHSVVLVRSDSQRFTDMLARSDFKDLRYPDRATKVRSEAFQSLLWSGKIRHELVQELKEIATERPSPDLYGLIVVGLDADERCLRPLTVQYLLSELTRLSEKSPLYRNGVQEVTESSVVILKMLEENARNCGAPAQYSSLVIMRNSVERMLRELTEYYKGQLF